jgi:hypothetical protein
MSLKIRVIQRLYSGNTVQVTWDGFGEAQAWDE